MFFASTAACSTLTTPQLSIVCQIIAFMGFVILGTYVYAKFKQNSFRLKHNGKDLQHLTILETRTLGNRQHLIVVAYKNQKILLSASPNEIRYLCELRDRSFHSSKK